MLDKNIDLSDPLAIFDSLAEVDFQAVDTSFPNLNPGTYEFEITKASKEQSEKTGGFYLLFNTKLVTSGARDTAGNELNPGYPVRHMINLTPSEKQLAKDGAEGCVKKIQGDVAKFLDAVVGSERTWDPTLELYVGKNFFAKTRVSKERTDEATGQVYAPSTEFASFLPKTEQTME
jgi:hypothetical protein